MARQLVKLSTITSQRPSETVSCPATAGSACSVKIVVLAGHGSERLGSGSATVRASRIGTVHLRLTKARKKAVKRKGVDARLVVTIRAGGRPSSATLKTTIGRKKR